MFRCFTSKPGNKHSRPSSPMFTPYQHTIVHVTDPQRQPLVNLVLLNLRRPVTRTTYAKPEDPQCDPPLLLSLSTSRPRLLQTVYRPILHIFDLFPQYPFLLFRGIHATTTSPPPARTCQGRWDEGRIYDLECVEVWECLACNDKFRYHRTCYSSRVEQNSCFPTL